MSWPFWIGVTPDGIFLQGMEEINEYGGRAEMDDCEQIYQSQIEHRTVVKLAGQWRIVTPTDKKAINMLLSLHMVDGVYKNDGA